MVFLICPNCESQDVNLSDELEEFYPKYYEVYCGNCGWTTEIERKDKKAPLFKEK